MGASIRSRAEIFLGDLTAGPLLLHVAIPSQTHLDFFYGQGITRVACGVRFVADLTTTSATKLKPGGSMHLSPIFAGQKRQWEDTYTQHPGGWLSHRDLVTDQEIKDCDHATVSV